MLDQLQLPILVVALMVTSWAVIRLLSIGSRAESVSNAPIPTEVLQWQRDLKRLSADLQRELDEKMEAVAALSEAYESASTRLRGLIQNAEAIQELSGEARRRSA